jgi:poly-gamma-glutamate synthesis protein (capsule biosynthesis protein)
LLGDVMLGRGVTPSEDSLAYLAPYLRSADLALANLESSLTTAPSQTSGYSLCAAPERVRYLVAAGLDLLSVANNHSLDCGSDGLTETESTLRAAGLTPLDAQPVYHTINGLRLAFLAFDDVSAPLDVDAAAQAIEEAHDSDALVVVSIHWGMEYQGGASERQRMLAQEFVEAGASLIWGHHPHVLQPAEWIRPPAGSEPARGANLVLYSLGNALFDQGGLADTRQSALVLVELDENGVRGAHAIPFVIDVSRSRVMAADEQTAPVILERLGSR